MKTWLMFGRRPVGHVDHVSDRIVRGWACAPSTPFERIGLDVFRGEVFLGQTTTGAFRPDLLAEGMGDGRHGFLFHLPDGEPDAGIEDIEVVTTGGRAVSLNKAHVTRGRPPRDPATFFGPYLATLRSDTAPALVANPGQRTTIDAICAPGRSCSAFVTHIAAKYDQPLPIDGDPASLWSWYLDHYVTERGPQRAPLSDADIQILMHADDGTLSFAAGLFPGPRAATKSERRYAWAIEESRRLFVEDRLVSGHDADALRQVPGRGLLAAQFAFPLSLAMQTMRRRHAMLGRVPVHRASGRRRLYALIMLLALRSPHYLAYLPSVWLQRMLRADLGPSVFETSLADLFGAPLAVTADRYVALIEAAGFDIATQTFQGSFYRGHRVRGGASIVTGPASVDVQIIGPLALKLGLAESGRRLVKALRTTGFSVNAVDYHLGTASGTAAGEQGLGLLRPARLNILHLNAEEIPEAYAYLPDVFSRSRTVAVPYWELSRPSAVHKLGLAAVDEVWVTSHFLAGLFRASGRPVHWIGMAHDDHPMIPRDQGLALRARFGIAPDRFAFLTSSDALSWAQRKNPLAVIEAFQVAFTAGEAVALIVKTHNLKASLSPAQQGIWAKVRDYCASDPRIVLVEESLEADGQRALLAGSDCLVSLHRAEGLGLDLLDAAHIGLPLVATAYSGNMDFCSNETAWLVDFDLRPVERHEYSFVEPGHVWAEPRPASAIAAMKNVYADRDGREARVRSGRAYSAANASLEAFAGRLEQQVRRLLG